jgi:parvulin-like peptidyl-prolyl isomerase
MRDAAFGLALALAAAVASAQDEDRPLLIVNGEPIMRSALAKILAPLEKAGLPEEQVNEIARRNAGRFVKDVLLRQFMQEEGYRPSEEEIGAEVARLRRVYESNRQSGSPSFEEALRRQGTSVDEMRTRPTTGMMFSCYVRSGVSDRDLLRLFETERCGFDGTEVRVRHILTDPERMAGKSELARRDMARQRAVEIRALVLEAGPDREDEKFAELAGRHSHCASAAKGGDLGFFKRFGVMVEEFSAAAFAAEVGDIPPVVETRFGFHVVKVTDRRPGRAVTLEDVRDDVADVWAKRRGLDIYDELYRKAKIERPE